MVSISLCMIVKNEEKVIARCLESVAPLVDEIIIVDTGSSDRTKEIVKKFTDQIYDFEWEDDFAKARNFAFSKASKEYTLWLDADDVILEPDQEKFKELKKTLDSSVDSVQMKYVLLKDEHGAIISSLNRNRLLKTSNKFKWIGAVHEYVEVGGNIILSEICITHQSIKTGKTDRNIKIYRKQMEKGLEFTPRDLFYYANECYEHNLNEEAITYYKKFLDTERGWFDDCIRACDQGAEAYIRLGNTKEAIMLILRSFSYAIPRANLCCKLGYLYMEQKEFDRAVYWYEAALKCDVEKVKSTGGLVDYAYYTWLPHLQLCVCYDTLQQHERAFYHNEMARLYNPGHESVLHNKRYLETLLQHKE
ncbi:tetratricopeptide repeat-containing glycosyltransferase family 2 protein [Bacillus massiliigorillae]|uniref:tetratricopeptide repeat-containing glycosyltransferase family 2 protein n=1 Tax=Bacillus massiliigorillae TaxID=1243664 RepID=UPI0003A03A1A|nr:glycosyltransferase [Bacillus massiliigorillae]